MGTALLLTADDNRGQGGAVANSSRDQLLAELEQIRRQQEQQRQKLAEVEAMLKEDAADEAKPPDTVDSESTGEHAIGDLDASTDVGRYVLQPGHSLRAAEAQARRYTAGVSVDNQAGSGEIPGPVWQATLEACTARALTQTQLARHVGASAETLGPVLEAMYARGLLANIGTDQHPRWITRVGDHASPEKLEATVRFLCSDAPRSMQELVDLTGARQSRVNGARLQLERNQERIVNLGTGKYARWYLLPPQLRRADEKKK
jgi:hypothetical protein